MSEQLTNEISEFARKIIARVEKTNGFSEKAKSMIESLKSLVGYGEKEADLRESQLRSATDAIALIEHEASDIDADMAKEVGLQARAMISVLREAGEKYKYPAFNPPSGFADPTYFAPFSGADSKRKPSLMVSESEVKNRRLVEGARLAEAEPDGGGLEWKIVLIEAGLSKNRRFYSPNILKEALPYFDGLSSYADHPGPGDSERSVRDLAGWVTDPYFDESVGDNGAIVGHYHALSSGPIANVLQEAFDRGRPDLIQFSILGEGPQQLKRTDNYGSIYEVQSIETLYSLDAVAQGAAGGRVLDIVESVQKEAQELALLDDMSLSELVEARPDLAEALAHSGDDVTLKESGGNDSNDAEANSDVAESVSDQRPGEESKLAEAFSEELRRMREELSRSNRSNYLKERLSASDLPEPVKTRLREDFEGRVFDEQELDEAIEREGKVWKDILRDKPRPKDLRATETRRDRLTDAVYGMLINEDVNGVPRFQSTHQAYCSVTGLPMDTGARYIADALIQEGIGWMPGKEGSLRESVSWTNVFGSAMTRKLVDDYQIPAFDEWRQIVSDIGDLKSMKEQKVERIGYYGVLPDVDEGGTYQPLSSPGEVEATYSPSKKGGLEDWTWEDALNDDLGALRKIPRKLALAAKITLYQSVFDLLRLGHTTNTTYDATPLFDSSHGNYGDMSLTSANLTSAKVALRDQTALGSAAMHLAVRPKYLIVPNELESIAIQLRDSRGDISETNAADKANPHRDTFDIIVVDYFTDANRWFLCGDPNLVPTIEVGFLGGSEEPELFTMAENTGSSFTADKIVFKIRFVFGTGVLDHRGLYGSDPDW
jgi:hypothetical protein